MQKYVPLFALLVGWFAAQAALCQTPDTLRLSVCNQFWKNQLPVPGMVVAVHPPALPGNPNADSTCRVLKFAPASGAKGYCPEAVFNRKDYQNGATVADFMHIRNHILGVGPLGTPGQQFAADVNRSGSITTFDIAALQNLLLGLADTLPKNIAWQAFSSTYEFPNPNNPFGSGGCAGYSYVPSLLADTTLMIACKVGDVDGDAGLNGAYKIPHKFPPTPLLLPEKDLMAGDTFLYAVRAGESFAAAGVQMAFRIDTALGRFTALIPEKAGALLNVNNYNLARHGEARMVYLSSFSASPILPNDILFFLKIKAKQAMNTRVVQLDTLLLPALWADAAIDLHPFIGKGYTVAAPILPGGQGVRISPPSPNPLIERALLGIYLPTAATVRLDLMDAAGRLVVQEVRSLDAGEHQLDIQGEGLPLGLLFWRLSSGSWSQGGKLLRL